MLFLFFLDVLVRNMDGAFLGIWSKLKLWGFLSNLFFAFWLFTNWKLKSTLDFIFGAWDF